MRLYKIYVYTKSIRINKFRLEEVPWVAHNYHFYYITNIVAHYERTTHKTNQIGFVIDKKLFKCFAWFNFFSLILFLSPHFIQYHLVDLNFNWFRVNLSSGLAFQSFRHLSHSVCVCFFFVQSVNLSFEYLRHRK